MKQLTQKEEEIMERMWDHGPLLVRELQAYYDEPRPHVNTLATLMKILEENGFLGHHCPLLPVFCPHQPRGVPRRLVGGRCQ